MDGDSGLVETLAEERQGCAQTAQAVMQSFRGEPIDLECVAARVLEVIRARGASVQRGSPLPGLPCS